MMVIVTLKSCNMWLCTLSVSQSDMSCKFPFFIELVHHQCKYNNMEKFITSIKKKYRERLLVRERQWPIRHSSKIISLLLVSRKVGEVYFSNQQRGKTVEEPKQLLLDYSELFGEESRTRPVRKVLIEGDAGIGKTTFCLSLTEDWANGEIFQQFKLVLFLPLRHRTVSSAGTLLELLKLLHPSTEVCEHVARFLIEEEGEEVLIIADGWDELDKSGRQEGSLLYRLLFESLPFASVILTSRPAASSSFLQLTCIDRYVEIHGFSKIKSSDYILSEFADDKDKAYRLLNRMNVTPFVESICSVPLNCAILCHLWRTHEEALPTTMTSLYTKIILNIILHNLQKTEAYKGTKCLDNFDALPADLVESWWLLCGFAYCAMEEDRIIFSRKELVSFFPQGLAMDEKLLCFGLLQSAEPIRDTGCGVSFHFLHQIFQEYLAALHIAKQPQDKQLEIIHLEPNVSQYDEYPMDHTKTGGIKYMWVVDRLLRFSSVWRFLCGIYFSEPQLELQQSHKVEYLADSLLTKFKKTLVVDEWLHLCLMAFEAQNVVVNQKVIQLLHEVTELQQSIQNLITSDHAQHCQQLEHDDSIVLGRPFLSAYDCAAIVYLVSNFQGPTTIMLNFSYSGIGDDSIRALANALASKNGELQVQRISLEGNKLADKSIANLFSRASKAFKSLQMLEVSNNEIRAESLNSIATWMETLSFTKLLTLDLSLNPLGISGVEALDKVARSDVLANLLTLNLQGSLTDDTQVNADLLIRLALSCHRLSCINFSQNNLGLPGSVALTRIIFKTQSMISSVTSWILSNTTSEAAAAHHHDAFPVFEIDVNKTELNLMVFISFLENQTYFDILDLRNNGILGPDLLCLSHAICTYRIMIRQSLLLGGNPLGPKGANIVGLTLCSCIHRFTMLDLSHCQLTSTRETSSDPSRFNCDKAYLIKLGQELCRMPQTDILIHLTLDGNSFAEEGVYILAGFIHLCRCLKILSCVNCQINSADLIKLFDIVFGQPSPSSQHPCRELIGWYLDYNNIDDNGLSALLEIIPSLFPKLGSGIFVFEGNPVSPEMIKRINCETNKYYEVRAK